ncbi:hypothetical protein R2360_13620 [Mycobacteroides chelonae]|nr:hypothetical protein [Mycobacteroides chelonae]MEC4843348.1 hypothetical protein [Mycobacteroides chelonae]
MERPTKAFLEMVTELADKLEAVSREILPARTDEDVRARPWSPCGLRAYVRDETAKLDAADELVEGLARSIARMFPAADVRPEFNFAVETSRTIARHIATEFDVKPKVGV